MPKDTLTFYDIWPLQNIIGSWLCLGIDFPFHENKIKFYSDKSFQIVQKETGKVFDFVVDPYPSKYSYDEGDSIVEGVVQLE